MRLQAVPSGCIVNGSLRRVRHLFFPNQTVPAAGMRLQAVPSGCIVNGSLRRVRHLFFPKLRRDIELLQNCKNFIPEKLHICMQLNRCLGV